VSDETMETRVREILRRHSGLGAAALDLDIHASLWQQGMTSLASVDVMVALETNFGFEFPDSWLRHATFGTVFNIMGCITALTDGALR
jgi:acyl carrier protein